jgi:glucose-6-phosphate 1-dehydrogenase
MVMNPGDEMVGSPVELLACQRAASEKVDPYERLLHDAMKGDATLFAREDYVEEAWRVVGPILGNVTPVYEYDCNTWGPREMEKTIAPPGGWVNPVGGC